MGKRMLWWVLPLVLLAAAACGDDPGAGERLSVRQCGDGVVQGGEECDDGNVATEACAYGQASCEVCDAACRLVPGATSACGDGRIDATHETCDDGNTATEECPYGARCSVCDATCTQRQVRRTCGDGVLDADGGELCDDGPANDDRAPGACRTNCTPARCGDGVIDPGETCETPGRAGCNATCNTGTCGDGVRDPWEICDPAVDEGCRSDCTMPACGDGRLDPGEACDEGALAPRAIAGDDTGLCAIVENGVVRCWSENPALDAVPPDLPKAVQLTSAGTWACILDTERRPHCWGESPLGDAPGGPLDVPDGFYTQISAGFAHGCGLRDDGSLVCWGRIGPLPMWSARPVQLASGHGFTCALLDDRTVRCLGASTFDELNAPLRETFTEVAAGPSYACGVRTGGGISCWGRLPGPAPAQRLHGLALGRSIACGLDDGGAAVCWGATNETHAGPFTRLHAVGGQVCGTGPAGFSCWGGLPPVRGNGGLPGACRAGCAAPTCGDGVTDPDEDCDDGDTIDSGNGCSAQCTRVGTCGDGVVQPAFETCDDGNTEIERCGYEQSCVVCGPSCTWTAGREARCGDGVVDGSEEECDDGNGERGYVRVALGGNSGCAVRENGSLVCFGDLRLADPPGGAFREVAAGDGWACAIARSGELRCWGGQAPPPQGRFVALSAGPRVACAIRDDARLACWGEGAPEVPAEGRWRAVSVGPSMACALDEAGALSCWGDADALAQPRPEGPFTGLAVGSTFHCAIRTDGLLACWGATPDKAIPAFPVVAVAAGSNLACAIDRADAVTCFGRFDGPVPEDGRYGAISVGGRWACGMRLDGTAKCWGQGFLGLPANDDDAQDACRRDCRLPACGDGVIDFGETCDDGNTLTEACLYGEPGCQVCGPACTWVEGTASFCGDGVVDPVFEGCDDGNVSTSDVAFGDGFGCGRGGYATQVVCWGRSDAGQTAVPPRRHGAMAVGARHACAYVGSAGAVECWGEGAAGQLEPPDLRQQRFPSLVAGRDFTCASAGPDAGIACWGDVPFTPPSTGTYSGLTAGDRHLCARTPGIGLQCWGANDHGQTSLPPIPSDLAVAAGRNHTCATFLDEALPGFRTQCWGEDAVGDPPPSMVPLFQLVAGDGFSCGRGNSSDVWTCWGAGAPVLPPGYAGPLAVSRWDRAFACGAGEGGDLVCWGTPHDPASLPATNSDGRAGACRRDCRPARCGDGVVDPGEACDDGNTLGGDGCDRACAIEPV